jgi:hypothetical protein
VEPQIVQNLRYKLQKRVRRLNSVSQELFASALVQFWAFFDANPTYYGIAELLSRRYPEVPKELDRMFAGEAVVGATEEESAAIGLGMLRRIAASPHLEYWRLGMTFIESGKSEDALELIRDLFLEPFYEYIDEKLDDQRAMLSLLFRYKQRSEWFHRSRLWTLIQEDMQRGERALSLDLYAFLHDQGIDFTIEPSSITGEIDLIAAQGSIDPLLADAKIFDGEDRGKSYLRKAFNQIYTYTQQYNEPFGYLVVFKTTDRDLRFALSDPSPNVPVILHNHKTIFVITIDIYPHPKPVSQRGPLKAIEITEEELVATDDAKPKPQESQ